MGTFPDRDSLVPLVGTVLAEQHDEWAQGRRYLGLEVLQRSRLDLVADPAGENATAAQDVSTATTTVRQALTA